MIKLFINNQEVDLNQKDVNVTIDYSIENIELGNISGAHSKRNVTLPGTKTNIEIFENIETPNVIVNNAYKLLPARLEANGVPILTGKARLDSGELNAMNHGFKANNYKVALIGNNADWFADVGNILVRSLGWQDITVSTATVKANYNPLTSEHCFILMKWKAWENETYIVDNELTPAIFIWQILEKAFQNKGYQLNSIFKTDPFSRLIIPMGLNLDADYIADFVNMRASNPSPSSFVYSAGDYGTVDIAFTNETTSPNFDTGGNYSGGVYTVPINALYELIAELNVTFSYLSLMRTVSPSTKSPRNSSAMESFNVVSLVKSYVETLFPLTSKKRMSSANWFKSPMEAVKVTFNSAINSYKALIGTV